MTKRRRTIMTVALMAVAILAIAGVAWAQGVLFPDVNPDDPHADAIQWAADNGIVQGYTNGNFGPYDEILRGQAATMFKRFDDYVKSSMNGGQDGDCAACHDDSQLIPGYQTSWSESLHATGTAFSYAGGRGSCAGCHSGGTFQQMIEQGLGPDEWSTGDVNPTPINCRTCHQTHETYTGADWALETTAAVDLFAVEGVTFDGGMGNLCVNCHQPRRVFPGDPDEDGTVTGLTSHWGPHHGPQSAMLLGQAGAGVATNPVSPHYSLVADTCVSCHVVDPRSHTFSASTEPCQTCHPGIEDFDVNGFQTMVQQRLDAIGADLVAAGLLTSNDADGHPTQTAIDNGVSVDEGIALWNWIYIAHEDESMGVHNPTYTEALLDAAEAAGFGGIQ